MKSPLEAASGEDASALFTRRIGSIAALTDGERQALMQVPILVRDLPAGTDIVREKDRPDRCVLVLSGFAIRYKLSADGERHIIAFHVPGDIPDLQSLHLAIMDHTLASLTAMRAGFIAHDALHALCLNHPRLAGALWRATLVDAAIFRQWIVNLGQLDAVRRTAHFLCEMRARLQAVGLSNGGTMELPMSQADLSEALGITSVHMNRIIQELRSRNLIDNRGRTITTSAWAGLQELGGFDPDYLHFTPDEPPYPA